MENNASKPTVLFVDDDLQIRKALKRVVDKEPYQSLFAKGGIQALDLLKQKQVQVIVADLRMPQMGGLTLLKKVQQDYPDIIRIILTALNDSETILEALHAGNIYRYITKPYDERELVHTIRQALESWQVHSDKRKFQIQLAEQNRLLEKRVTERTAQLLAIERQAELGRYAAQIVHNLNGPLQGVMGQISLAKMSLLYEGHNIPSVEKHLDLMKGAAEKLSGIVHGILRHSQNPAQLDQQWTQFNQVIKKELQFFEANKTFKSDAVQKQIQLADSIPPVWVNPLHLQQIMDNLIHNALDAMADCQPKILTIATYATKQNAFMEVCDTGTGIDPKNLPFIFEPDFTTKPPDKGTGLGLASVKTMVEGYGGRVEVRPNKPQGTKFVIRFPLKKNADVGKEKSACQLA